MTVSPFADKDREIARLKAELTRRVPCAATWATERHPAHACLRPKGHAGACQCWCCGCKKGET